MSDIKEDRRLHARIAEVRRSAGEAFETLRGGGDNTDGDGEYFPWLVNILTTPRDLEILAGELEAMSGLMKAVQVSAQTLQVGFSA